MTKLQGARANQLESPISVQDSCIKVINFDTFEVIKMDKYTRRYLACAWWDMEMLLFTELFILSVFLWLFFLFFIRLFWNQIFT